MSFIVNLLLIELFSLLVIVTLKGRRNIINGLVIFHCLNAVKFMFLCVWVTHKAGWLDLDYLLTNDERYYLSGWQWGEAVANVYKIIVYGLQSIGFSINNIKVLNIAISSFAIVRLYTLKDLVRNQRRYVIYLLLFVGFLFLHITYLSIFVHKDAVFFYVTVELFILLIKRPIHNRWVLIGVLATVLMFIRRPMFFGLSVFLFDRNWRVRPARVVILILLLSVVAWYYATPCRQRFRSYIANGLHTNLDMAESASHVKAYALSGGFNYADSYKDLVFVNFVRATSVVHQSDITYSLILVLEWLTVIYLLGVRKNIIFLLRFWPILVLPFLYFIGGVLTLYNMRYSIFPVTFLICLSVYVASCPVGSPQVPRCKYTG